MKILPKLPSVITVKNNIRVIPDFMQRKNIPDLFRIAEENIASPGTGVSPLDFSSEEHLVHISRVSLLALQYTMESSGKCVGFTVAYPSEICRSCRPISIRGFTVLDPKIHNIGLGQWGLRIIRPWSTDAGIPGWVGRSAATNILGILHAKKAGLDFQAVVPDSYKDIEGRWHDDLINTNFYPSSVYQMKDTEVLEKASTNPIQFVYSKTPIKGKNISQEVTLPNVGSCVMHTANEQDLGKVYHLLFNSAKHGEGFGLDELPTYNIFRNHFLKERTLFMLDRITDQSKDTVAVSVVGPSRICRSPDPPSCSVYMLVMPEWRNQGLGTDFARLTFQYIKDSGYNAVLTDVLVTDRLPYSFMTRLGFSNVGCIPKSAFVAGRGYSDAILFYMKLKSSSHM